MTCWRSADHSWDDDDDWDDDGDWRDVLDARLADPANADDLPFEVALGDGACVRRIRAHRPVRILIGPQGRGRVRSHDCGRMPA